jgi:hypothetical protein
MSLDAIDAELADWKTRIQLVSDNIIALRESAAYQRLRGEGGWPKLVLAGETQTRVASALAALQELWTYYALLTETIDRACALRATVSWLMPSRATLAEIERTLRGPSIKLPATATPLASRGLLTAAEVTEAVTPGRLLEAMSRSFETARDAVVAVEAAWDHATAVLGSVEVEAAALAALAASLGEGVLPAEVAEARRIAAALRALTDTDPLAAGATANQAEGLLKAARARLEEVARGRDQVRVGLAGARRLWQVLQDSHQRAAAAGAERALKVLVEDECSPPTDEEQFNALGAWLDRLDATAQKGGWKAVKVGLVSWTRAARECLSHDEAAFAASDVLLRERRNLRGLLEALKAKAAAVGRAEDPEASALAAEAWRLLHTRPAPLRRAQELVRDYEARLL